jgi:hypothetical protein
MIFDSIIGPRRGPVMPTCRTDAVRLPVGVHISAA